jgi:hypothetical protein
MVGGDGVTGILLLKRLKVAEGFGSGKGKFFKKNER